MSIKPGNRYQIKQIDNPICKRRFHVCWEEGDSSRNLPVAEARCQHCNAIVYSAPNHPPVMISREENLVKSPDGSREMMRECFFTGKNS